MSQHVLVSATCKGDPITAITAISTIIEVAKVLKENVYLMFPSGSIEGLTVGFDLSVRPTSDAVDLFALLRKEIELQKAKNEKKEV